MPKKPELIDGVIKNLMYPKTFQIPNKSERLSVQAGSFVKIGIDLGRHGGERFWVRITESIPETGSYVGRIDNNLVYRDLHGLEMNDLVELNEKNILSIM